MTRVSASSLTSEGPSAFAALTCVQCDRTNADGVCQSRESSCQTSGFQQCFLRKVYEVGNAWCWGVPGWALREVTFFGAMFLPPGYGSSLVWFWDKAAMVLPVLVELLGAECLLRVP